MKNVTRLLLFIALIGGEVIAQTYPHLYFRRPTSPSSNVWRFTHVTSGIDAFISVVGTKNASLNRIDDSSVYRHAWNPHIRVNSGAGSSDSSYVEFQIDFRYNSDGTPATLTNMAMTVVDLDGNGFGSFREMVVTSLPATPVGIVGSTISNFTSLNLLTLISGPLTFNNTDTSNIAAMSQINYANIQSYRLKVGVVGAVNSNTTRQFSFYFKGFNSMVFVLPIKLIGLEVSYNHELPVVKWSTTSEINSSRFEIYRSLDGVNYEFAGQVSAAGNSATMLNYSFSDKELYGQQLSQVFYKIRMVDNDGEYAWSNIVHYSNNEHFNTELSLSVFPNPCLGQLNISVDASEYGACTLEITDMFGKVVKFISNEELTGNSSLSIDVNELNPGIYFVRVNDNGKIITKQFIRD